MITIGLIGGVASGKSAVARLLADRGAAVIDADAAGHRVLREPWVKEQLVARWGPGILDAEGEINRKAVAKIVFAPGNEDERLFLNSVMHPRIGAQLAIELSRSRKSGVPAAVLDAALLLEADWNHLCHEIIFVDAPLEQRLARARARGWDEAELARRESTQLPLDQKKERATICLPNDGSHAELAARVGALADQWGLAQG